MLIFIPANIEKDFINKYYFIVYINQIFHLKRYNQENNT